MEKKQYIQPQIKNSVLKYERSLMQQGSEETSNPWDWNTKQGFVDEEEGANNLGNVWNDV